MHKAPTETETPLWYVLRDLKRSNANDPGYKTLAENGFEVFTPMKWVVQTKGGKRVRRQMPVVADLLFAHAMREDLDPVIEKTPTLQYRYLRGAFCKPMTVGEQEMRRFINAVNTNFCTAYYTVDEISSLSVGKNARIIGGPMDGLEGRILKVRGARKKRLLIELPSFIAASIEVEPEFIQFTD